MPKPTTFITTIKKSTKEKLSQKLEVVILSASIPFGMINYGPKSTILHNNKNLIEHQIEVIRSVVPHANIIVCCGFQMNKMKNSVPKGCRIVENQLYEETLEGEQIRLCMNNCETKNVLFISPDIVFSKKLIQSVIEENSSCLVHCDNLPKDEVGIIYRDGEVLNFSYSFQSKWGYIAYVKDNEFDRLYSVVDNFYRKKWLFFECMKESIKNGGKYKPLKHNINKYYTQNRYV